MKLFDPRAALAEIRKQGPTPATPATSATQTTQNALNVAKVADVATPQRQIPKNEALSITAPNDDMRHGFAVNGNPMTWTGNIVGLDDWRGLSEWQKRGPNGRMWCGVCKVWSKDCRHIKNGERA